MQIAYRSIGTIHSPFTEIADMPIQPRGAERVRGTVVVLPQYAPGLADLDGFSHVILLYHFHRVSEWKLTVTPFLDTRPRGLFATRAPKRPNPIGLSVVALLGTQENILEIENVDILDGTPLLDIKPYVPQFDHWDATSIGWLENAGDNVGIQRSDDRFR